MPVLGTVGAARALPQERAAGHRAKKRFQGWQRLLAPGQGPVDAAMSSLLPPPPSDSFLASQCLVACSDHVPPRRGPAGWSAQKHGSPSAKAWARFGSNKERRSWQCARRSSNRLGRSGGKSNHAIEDRFQASWIVRDGTRTRIPYEAGEGTGALPSTHTFNYTNTRTRLPCLAFFLLVSARKGTGSGSAPRSGGGGGNGLMRKMFQKGLQKKDKAGGIGRAKARQGPRPC